jgi:hypothetical protein
MQFESLSQPPLPNRSSFLLSLNGRFHLPDCLTAYPPAERLAYANMAGMPHRPIAKTVLQYHLPHETRDATPNPTKEPVLPKPTRIFDFLAIKQATWPTWKPWQIFEAERVIDIEHGIEPGDLNLVSNDESRHRIAGQDKWDCLDPFIAYHGRGPLPRELLQDELKSLNDKLRAALRGIMITEFGDDPRKPEYLGLHVRGSHIYLLG